MWRSLVARTVRDREAASSSLVTSTKCFVPEKYGAHVDIFGDFLPSALSPKNTAHTSIFSGISSFYSDIADFGELFVAISDDTDITINKKPYDGV